MGQRMGQIKAQIIEWITEYAKRSGHETLVVGVSGGIDSAVVSTLCAMTGLATLAVCMPIRQSKHTHELSTKHAHWLTTKFDNATNYTVDLTATFNQFTKTMDPVFADDLAYANSRSRMRMMALYQIAQCHRGLVVGTGNRVEDFGVGFFTKYGDGGVDLSPIADLLKTEVWALGKELNILPEIISAEPTDGLWDDGRTDQDQLGMTYEQLELAMAQDQGQVLVANSVELERLQHYQQLRARNLHKMEPIPVFKRRT